DEVQAFKAGFTEIGDLFVVNKADLVNPSKTMYNIASGLKQREDGWRPPVLKTSALKGTGDSGLVDALERYRKNSEEHASREKVARAKIEAELVETAYSD